MEEYRIGIACFLILSFSIVLLASQGTTSSYLNKSWANEPKDNSTSDKDQEISTLPSQDSEGANQAMNKLTDKVLSGDEVSEDDNQTTTEIPAESESNQTSNQTTETQNQTQNNQEVNIQNNIQMKELEIIISEEEGQAPIP